MARKRILVLITVVALLTLFSVLPILQVRVFPFEANASPAIGSSTVTLYSVGDACVNASNPGTNYGAAGSMYVSANSEQVFTYLKFDLTSIPSGANIISAKLAVYLLDTGGNIYWMPADKIGAYYCPDSAWTEYGITWNNKPSFARRDTGLEGWLLHLATCDRLPGRACK